MILTNEQRLQTEATELFVWDADDLYSSTGHQMLHSLGAIFDRHRGKIRVYTTNHARQIPGANTTFTIREVLKGLGFSFDGIEKHWEIPLNEENTGRVLGLLRQYDTKRWPEEPDVMARCARCGAWFYPRPGDWDTHEWYCGC